METTIGDVTLNDSLHFPGTHLLLHSANDQSAVQITTSANQTLNSANISARVETLPTGVQVTFNPSTFDINSKTWTIDRDGIVTFNHNIFSAENFSVHNGDQQVLMTTHPSDVGNWNDIHVDLKKVNIGDFTPFVEKAERLEGLLTGNARDHQSLWTARRHLQGNRRPVPLCQRLHREDRPCRRLQRIRRPGPRNRTLR